MILKRIKEKMTNIFNDFDPYIWKKDMQYIYEVEKIISKACGDKKVGTYVGKYVILCLVEYFDFDIQIQKYHQKYLIHKKDFERCSILKKKYSTCVEYTPRIGSERTEFYNNFWHCDRNFNNRNFLFACMLDQVKTAKDNLYDKVNYLMKKRNNMIYMLIHFKHFLINNLQSNKSIKEIYIIPTYEAYEKFFFQTFNTLPIEISTLICNYSFNKKSKYIFRNNFTIDTNIFNHYMKVLRTYNLCCKCCTKKSCIKYLHTNSIITLVDGSSYIYNWQYTKLKKKFGLSTKPFKEPWE